MITFVLHGENSNHSKGYYCGYDREAEYGCGLALVTSDVSAATVYQAEFDGNGLDLQSSYDLPPKWSSRNGWRAVAVTVAIKEV